MACGGSSNAFKNSAWTNGTTTPVFSCFTEPMNVSNVESIRVEMELRNRSGDIEIKRGLQYSDDGYTWDTATVFDDAAGWIATEGYSYGADYTLTDTDRRFVRFGVMAKRSTGTGDNEQCRVTYRLDVKSR
jgi:hypothetical protein